MPHHADSRQIDSSPPEKKSRQRLRAVNLTFLEDGMYGTLFLLLFVCPSLPAQVDTIVCQDALTGSPLDWVGILSPYITQDREGFLWIANNEQLYRYDPYHYARFADENGDALIPGTSIRSIDGGKHDYICACTWARRVVFFHTLHHTKQLLSLDQPGPCGTRRPTCALEDNSGCFWVGTYEGRLYSIHPPDSSVVVQFDHGGWDSIYAAIENLAEDSLGNIWFSSADSLWRIPVSSAILSANPKHSDASLVVRGIYVSGVTTARDGSLWVTTFDGHVGSIAPGSDSLKGITALPGLAGTTGSCVVAEDRCGDIWIATATGKLFRRRLDDGRWHTLIIERPDRSRLNTDVMVFFYIDRSGTLWIKSSGRGPIQRYTPTSRAFHAYPSSGAGGLTLIGQDIWACRFDRTGTLWTGNFSSGIEYRLPHERQFRQLQHDPHDSTSLSDNQIISICTCKNGEVWIGTLWHGVDIFDGHARRLAHLEPFQGDTTSLQNGQIKSMYEDHRGSVWVGNYFGLDRCDPGSRSFAHVLEWKLNTVGPLGSVTTMCEDQSSHLWIATLGRGLCRLDLQTYDTVCYRHDPVDTTSIASNSIHAVMADSCHRIWLGTDAGISCLDTQTGRFCNIPLTHPQEVSPLDPDRAPPASPMAVTGVVADNRGRLWLSLRDGGIGRYNITSHEFRRYGAEDGVVVTAGRRNTVFKASDGTIYFGGTGGINWFHPDSIADDDLAFNTAVTQIRIFGKPVDLPLQGSAALPMHYWQNTLSFAFALMDFTAPDKNSYQYMLEGVDQTWGPPTHEHEVTYANLAPGSYRFRVQGTNGRGIRSDNEASVAFTITPPYWQQWWFRALLVLLFAGALYVVYRIRIRRILELERLRIRIADDLHDDIGSALSGIALESDLLARRIAEDNPTRQRMIALGTKARHTSDTLRDTVWIINPEQDRVQDLVTRLREIASTALTDQQYSFETVALPPDLPVDMTFRRHVLLMFKEMLHNVTEHAHAKTVGITLAYAPPELTMSVRDDGVGFVPGGSFSGRGLRSMEARAAVVGGTFVLQTAPGAGTTVALKVRLAGRRGSDGRIRNS